MKSFEVGVFEVVSINLFEIFFQWNRLSNFMVFAFFAHSSFFLTFILELKAPFEYVSSEYFTIFNRKVFFLKKNGEKFSFFRFDEKILSF